MDIIEYNSNLVKRIGFQQIPVLKMPSHSPIIELMSISNKKTECIDNDLKLVAALASIVIIANTIRNRSKLNSKITVSIIDSSTANNGPIVDVMRDAICHLRFNIKEGNITFLDYDSESDSLKPILEATKKDIIAGLTTILSTPNLLPVYRNLAPKEP